jgi:hypothetical protein
MQGARPGTRVLFPLPTIPRPLQPTLVATEGTSPARTRTGTIGLVKNVHCGDFRKRTCRCTRNSSEQNGASAKRTATQDLDFQTQAESFHECVASTGRADRSERTLRGLS